MHNRILRVLTFLGIILLALDLAAGRLAQEFDTAITVESRRAVSIADEIADPKERKAFLQLYGEARPQRRAELAESFLADYPQSAFLAQVYELAARGYIDSKDYRGGLEHASRSLKLLPENPLFLVLVANTQALEGLTTAASESGAAALEYLDRFARPAAIPARKWPELERQLRASSYFALGRARAADAFRLPPGSEQKRLLEQAERALSESHSLNPKDPDAAYLLGLSFWALGKEEDAIRSFAAAYRITGDKSPAVQYLRKIYENSSRKNRSSFEEFVKAGSAAGRLRVPDAASIQGEPAKRAAYAGSAVCRSCHSSQHEAWQKTGMGRMFRPYRPEAIVGDFSKENEFYAGDEVRLQGDRIEVFRGKGRYPFARMLIEQERHYFEIKQSSGRWTRYPVDYTIGHKWQQAYATRLDNGRIHVLPIQYNVVHKQWLNFWQIIDPPGSERADIRTWPNLTSATSYEANCAVCHTSQLKNSSGRGSGPDKVEFLEPGVNCEMCHGPASRHVAGMTAGKPEEKAALEPPVRFAAIGSRDYVAICAQCHAQSALRERGPGGEMNYSGEEEDFFKRSKGRPLAEFSRKIAYRDGRLRETTFIVEALMRSACFRKGDAHCGHCHDPHGQGSATNLSSLKFSDRPDQMCLQCHTDYARRLEVHTRHPARSEASRCTSCHMPRIMNSLLFKSATHEIDDTPDAEMARRFGPEESPNACLLCHRDKDASWLALRLQNRVR
jgi:predicted CXXCH cytochrome family protein